MKRTLLIIALAVFSITAAAQVSDNLLTMEEAVLGRGLETQKINWHWTGDRNVYAIDGYYKVARRGQSRPETAPDGSFEVFPEGNNLHIRFTATGQEVAVTSETNPDIVSGDAVSRHEFGIEKGIFISPDSRRIAFYQKDESRVTEYPLVDIGTRTGSISYIKYPMNGMPSEIVRMGIYNILDGSTVWLDVTDFDSERYLTNVTWAPGGEAIYLQVLDRSQKHMHLNCYDAATGKFCRTLLSEDNERFVEPAYPLYFLENNPDEFIYTTDNRDGFRNLYLCSIKGGEPRRLTAVDADVEYFGQNGRFVYYYTWEVSPAERHFAKVDTRSGKMTRLTRDHGTHICTLSPDGKYFMDEYSALKEPLVVKLGTTDGRSLKEIYRADIPSPKLENCIIETGTIKSADGLYDNHYSLVKPADFDPTKKYPVVLYVYGGPHLQMITNSYLGGMSRWDILMAQKGYIVFSMDNRGTPYHGAEYEKAIHKQCGKAEMADQMEGMKWLMSHEWVDCDRIGVHGWSYGGFMTISLMVNYPEVFKVGVAGGPVIDWHWYEVMYGERYMETDVTNPEGFASTSLIPRAADLKGKLLICQGVIDDTVVWQHSLSFVESCIKNNVQVDYFPYPTHPHNVRGKDRVHLMDKVTAYFEDFLK